MVDPQRRSTRGNRAVWLLIGLRTPKQGGGSVKPQMTCGHAMWIWPRFLRCSRTLSTIASRLPRRPSRGSLSCIRSRLGAHMTSVNSPRCASSLMRVCRLPSPRRRPSRSTTPPFGIQTRATDHRKLRRTMHAPSLVTCAMRSTRWSLKRSTDLRAANLAAPNTRAPSSARRDSTRPS